MTIAHAVGGRLKRRPVERDLRQPRAPLPRKWRTARSPLRATRDARRAITSAYSPRAAHLRKGVERVLAAVLAAKQTMGGQTVPKRERVAVSERAEIGRARYSQFYDARNANDSPTRFFGPSAIATSTDAPPL